MFKSIVNIAVVLVINLGLCTHAVKPLIVTPATNQASLRGSRELDSTDGSFDVTLAVMYKGIHEYSFNDDLFFTATGTDIQRILQAAVPTYDFRVMMQEVTHDCAGTDCDGPNKIGFYLLQAICQTSCDIGSNMEDLVKTTELGTKLKEIASIQFPGVTDTEVAIIKPSESKVVTKPTKDQATTLFKIVGLGESLGAIAGSAEEFDKIMNEATNALVKVFTSDEGSDGDGGTFKLVKMASVSSLEDHRRRRHLSAFNIVYGQVFYGTYICHCFEDELVPDFRMLGDSMDAADIAASIMTVLKKLPGLSAMEPIFIEPLDALIN